MTGVQTCALPIYYAHLFMNMINNKNILWIFLLLSVHGCVNPRFDTKKIIELAGENRLEIEKVLKHYPAGSKKNKAAKFLIANMIYHEHFDGDIIDKYKIALDSAISINADSIWLEIKKIYFDEDRKSVV